MKALPLLFALLLACGWEPFSNGEEPADTVKHTPKKKYIPPPDTPCPKMGVAPPPCASENDSAERICVKLHRDYTPTLISPPQLGDYKIGMKISGASLYKSNFLAAPEHFVRAHYFSPVSLAGLIVSVTVVVYVSRPSEGDKVTRTELSLYRALVSPEVTYENTVWGKLRKKGETTCYAWHVIDTKKVDEAAPWNRFPHIWLFEWDPNRPVVWPPGAKEVYDELAESVSLTIPLTEKWEAYDLEFTPTVGRPTWARDCHLLPEHVRQSLVSGRCEAVQETERMYTATGPCHGYDVLPTLCFSLRRR